MLDKGLSEKQVLELRKKFGENVIPFKEEATWLSILFSQLKSPLIYIVTFCGLFSLVFKEYFDALLITFVVIVNVLMGFFQEYNAKKTLTVLRKILKPKTIVIREGQRKEIEVKKLVPDDLVVLGSGDRVPADGKLIEGVSLLVNEAILTGEEEAVTKNEKEGSNLLFMGTTVISGRGVMEVAKIGIETEMGKIGKSLAEIKEEKTPLQIKLEIFAKNLAIIVLLICLFIFVLGVFHKENPFEMFRMAVILSIAAIPEGLPIAITMILALGMRRILRRNGLVKTLLSIETLGSTSVICVPGDTLIWANSSIKPISVINENDRAMGIDRKFATIKKKFKRLYSGEMISIKPVGLPKVEFTPEHPILVAKAMEHRPCVKEGVIIHRSRIVEITKPKWIPASEVKIGYLVLVPRIKRIDAYGRFAIRFKKGKGREKIRVPLDQEVSELLGWYLAEGCCSSDKVIFYFGKNEKENIERVKYLIENKLHLKTYLEEKQTAFRLIFTNVDLARFFKNNFGPKAPFKKIPDFILFTTNRSIIYFLRGYLKGDGYADNYTLRFSTSSKQLVHQLILLLAKIGIRARVHHNKIRKGLIGEREINGKDSYEVFINGTQADIIYPLKRVIKYKKRNLVLKDENFIYFPIRSIKKENKKIEVFNIETKSRTYCLPFVVHNCTDKTGTLTEGKMKVVKTDFLDKDKALFALTLDNEQRSSLEVAIWEYVKNEKEFNPREIFDQTKRIYEEPFDSEKKYSMTINELEGREVAFLMGAPEIIISFCQILDKDKNKILEEIEKWADEGLRVLGVAFKEKRDLKEKKDFSWLGLIGIADPIRKEAKEAILTAQRAGIKIKIVTGDYRKTAERVASNLGFKLEPKNILEGQELEVISEEELKKRINDIILFTRVTPHQKQKIVKVLQERGETVAMTGDGVNDAPALKKANIGVTVGTASDVAKEAGDLILLDNNFKTIVAACEEGRLIFSNIKKVVGYALSDSFAEIALIFGAVLLNFPSPLTVIQILWIHLICDGPPDIMLAFEPKEKSLMTESPKSIKKEEILSGFTKFLILAVSLTASILSLLLFWHYGIREGNLKFGRTIAFTTIAGIDLIYVFAYKNLKKPIIKIENFFQNKFMFLGVAYGFSLLFLAIYLPFLNKVLGTIPLEPFHWLLIFGAALLTTSIVELVKIFSNPSLRRNR